MNGLLVSIWLFLLAGFGCSCSFLVSWSLTRSVLGMVLGRCNCFRLAILVPVHCVCLSGLFLSFAFCLFGIWQIFTTYKR